MIGIPMGDIQLYVGGVPVGRAQAVDAKVELAGEPLTEESFDEIVSYGCSGTFTMTEDSVKSWGEAMAKMFEAEKKRQIRLEKWRQDARASLRAMRRR